MILYFFTPLIPLIVFVFDPNTASWSPSLWVSVIAGVSSFVLLANDFWLKALRGSLEKRVGSKLLGIFRTSMLLLAMILGTAHRGLKLELLALEPLEATFALVLVAIPSVAAVLAGLITLVGGALGRTKAFHSWSVWLASKSRGVLAIRRGGSTLFPLGLGVILVHVLMASTTQASSAGWVILATWMIGGVCAWGLPLVGRGLALLRQAKATFNNS